MTVILLLARHTESLFWRKKSPSIAIIEDKSLGAEVAHKIGRASIQEGMRARDEILGRVVKDIEEGKRYYEPLKAIVEKYEPEYERVMKDHKQFVENWKEKISQLSFEHVRDSEIHENIPDEIVTRSPDNLMRRAVLPNELEHRFETLINLINYSKAKFLNNTNDLYELNDYIYYVSNLTYARQKAIDWTEIYKRKAEQSDIYVDPWIYFLGERFEYSTDTNDYQFNFNLSFLRRSVGEDESPIRERREARANRIFSVHDTSFPISHGRVSEISKDRRYMHFKDEESNNSATVKFYCGPNNFIRSVDEINESHVIARFETPLICSEWYEYEFITLWGEEFEKEFPWLMEELKRF